MPCARRGEAPARCAWWRCSAFISCCSSWHRHTCGASEPRAHASCAFSLASLPALGIIGGGLLAGILALFLRHPAERLLGSVSRDRLIDLTDLEQPLLKKMAAEAPGSWEHSRSMANLAEAAAAAIGADPLLTRVGAYYHDLGKTIQPKYFVENLLSGEPSPHDQLEPDVSADA